MEISALKTQRQLQLASSTSELQAKARDHVSEKKVPRKTHRFAWVLGIVLRSLCFIGIHFTDRYNTIPEML